MRLTYVLFIALFALVLSACEKNSPTDELTNLQELKTSIDYSSMTAEETEAHILSIIELVNYKGDADPRDATTYTDDETVWNIEATLSYTYADVESSFGDHDILVDTISLSRAAYDTVTDAEFSTLYDDVLDKVSDHYYSLSDTSRAPKVFDIYKVSATSSELKVGVRFVTGLLMGCDDEIYPYADADGDFHATYGNSSCSFCIAPESLTKSLNHHKASQSSKTKYFTEYRTIYFTLVDWKDDIPSDIVSNPTISVDNYDIHCIKWHEPSVGCDSLYNTICDGLSETLDEIRCMDYSEMNTRYLDINSFYGQLFTNTNWSYVNTEIFFQILIGPACAVGEWWESNLTIGKELTRGEGNWELTALPD